MIKKILLIALFLAVTFGVGFLIYRFFFAAPTPVVTEPTVEPGAPTTGLPVAGEGVPGVPGAGAPTPGVLPRAAAAIADGSFTQTRSVVSATVRGANVSSVSQALTFLNEFDGKFYRRLPDGTLRAMSDKSFSGADEVTWSRDGGKAVIGFPDEAKVIFDFESQRQVTIPRHWEDFSFTADGDSIVAKAVGQDPQNRWLVMAQADGSSAKLIEPLGDNQDKVTVSVSPDNSVIAFSDTGGPIGFDTREILLVGQNNENFKSLRVDGFGFEPQWSPDGQHLLYSASGQADGYRPSLWFTTGVGDATGSDRTKIALNTWADKCTFADAETVYCAVPIALPEGIGLQRDLADDIPDEIYRIDLRSGGLKLIGRPEQDKPMGTISVSPDGSTLFFTDARTRTLGEMRLK